MNAVTGYNALYLAEHLGCPIHMYNSPIEDAREDIGIEYAREVASEDPSLLYIEVDLPRLWDGLDTKIEQVCDEQGTNIAGAAVRRIMAELWIYADDVNGFSVVDTADVRRLLRSS